MALNKLGGKASLPEIYAVIEKTATDVAAIRKHWKERVRAELQRNFRNIERGIWAVS